MVCARDPHLTLERMCTSQTLAEGVHIRSKKSGAEAQNASLHRLI